MGRCCDPHRRFEHAAQHHLQAVGPSHGDHAQRFAQPSCFHHLDIHAIHASSQARDVAGRANWLVGENRQRRDLADPAHAIQILFGQGLLDPFQSQVSQGWDEAQCLVYCPGAIGIGHEPGIGDGADGSYDLQAVVLAQFELQDREMLCCVTSPTLYLLCCPDADGHRCWRRGLGVQTQQAIQWYAQSFSEQVVQGNVDRRACRLRARWQRCQEIFQVEGVLAQRRQGGEVGQHASLGFVMLANRGGFAQPFVFSVTDAHQYVVSCHARSVSNAERRLQVQGDRFNLYVHGPTPSTGSLLGWDTVHPLPLYYARRRRATPQPVLEPVQLGSSPRLV